LIIQDLALAAIIEAAIGISSLKTQLISVLIDFRFFSAKSVLFPFEVLQIVLDGQQGIVFVDHFKLQSGAYLAGY
jgi:hypothetical protein